MQQSKAIFLYIILEAEKFLLFLFKIND